MVIQFSSLPFKIQYSRRRRFDDEYVEWFNILKFYSSLSDIYSKHSTSSFRIKENINFELKINAPKPIRVYVAGMNAIQVKEAMVDENGEAYLEGNYDSVIALSSLEYPLPPGKFLIRVIYDGSEYYCPFEVEPLRLEDDHYNQMRLEVMTTLESLAYRMIEAGRSIVASEQSTDINAELFIKMQIVNKYYQNVVAVLEDLIKAPHSRISKRYVTTGDSRAVRNDLKADKLNKCKLIGVDKKYTAQKYTDYSLPENYYIKSIINELKGLLIKFNDTIDINIRALGDVNQTIKYRQNLGEIHLLDTRKKALKILISYKEHVAAILNTIYRISQTDWYKSLGDTLIQKFSGQSLLDPRYGILSKLHDDLMLNSLSFGHNRFLIPLTKRTDKLYELWGVLKVVEAFGQLGYYIEVTEGLMVSNDIAKEIDIDKNGFSITMRKGSGAEMVRLVFDQSLPSNKEDIVIDKCPILTRSPKNKPDLRVDFYLDDHFGEGATGKLLYANTLIIDFKYRNITTIEKECAPQLNSYKKDTKTICYMDESEQYSYTRVNPVGEVWAFYPDKYNFVAMKEEFYESIRYVTCYPGYTEHIKNLLENYIELYVDPDIGRYISKNGR